MSADQDPGAVLPVRTSRYRRTGRHSSPHQLSLPSDSPSLVIAVPGSARPESEEIAERIADMAAASCPGAEVRIGFLRGNRDHLEDVLADLVSQEGSLAGVVVPLMPFSNPEVDRAISDAVAAAEAPLLIADPLGPHPLLAEALHARLADVGLARAARVGRISIVTETAADGVIVGAVGGDEAVQAAEVVAVLLASRLTTPVAAASLTDPDSIKDAATRLRQAVPRVALAPCMVGPELTSGTLEAIAALTSTDCAPPLGSHPAVGKLVAIRYGAALADPQVAAMVARSKSQSAQSAANGNAPSAGHAEAPSAGRAEAPSAGQAETPPASAAEAPSAGQAEAPPASQAEAPPMADDGAGSLPASAPPAGTSAQ
jgi:sirohydrochlorin ferrochelatase